MELKDNQGNYLNEKYSENDQTAKMADCGTLKLLGFRKIT
jgi:hypothetical protein